ncbi:protein kinase C-binding protein NELL1-like [Mercenaria mercenaria]|uniref:protein kinase C-binding protein NELL1-like n=1 Tax=Mercenaria mercenaria TaxID=6596 RepID=UPI00234EC04A|nr:protein kinase C-binding protein NELL1-like [Mercenaria mercenaria]
MGIWRLQCIVHCFAFLFGLISTGFSFDLGARDVLDLLQFVNKTSSSFSYVNGTEPFMKAIYLEDQNRSLALPESVVSEALMLLRNNDDVTFLATVRQESGNSGSIFSFSAGQTRFLELESSGRRDEIRLRYKPHDQQIQSETFPFRLADEHWHQIALTFSGTHVTLYINCSKIYERVIYSLDKNFLAGNYLLSLYIGQRNQQSAYFRGAIQELKIVTKSHGYLVQCPEQNTRCPTCAQFQALQSRMKEMYSLYQNLSIKLLQAEERISGLEQCQCLKSCHQNGTERKEGELWQMDQCTICMCRNGTIECRNVDCPPVDCPHPVHRDGECCPVCLTNCYYSGKYYEHGDAMSPKMCVTCTCDNGVMLCERQDPETTCPKLECEPSEIIRVQNECCPICRGTDFCALGNDCHGNSTCVNLATKYACQCKLGFQGNGKQCEDIDECLEIGGKRGHHCHRDQKCVNTIGSYKCTCMSGHEQKDDQSCSEIDECAVGLHTCDNNAICINTRGSYECTCHAGYQGDGFTCIPICEGGCRNGGRCVGPNICECRHGFIGPSCQHDIDECLLGISACHAHSVCINTPGWYKCDCIEGYHSHWPENHYGSLCVDVNECVGEGEGHTCHSSTECVNTDGGYGCECKANMKCHKNCLYGTFEHTNGDKWMSELNKCLACECKDGVSECFKNECNCSADDVDLECCQHCDASATCYHADTNAVYNNGERWQFECDTCECLDGEIDCWPVRCPAKVCNENIQEPGDCCPRCADDMPCDNAIQELGGADLSAFVCVYEGETRKHGDVWNLKNDECTRCECKAGHICCTVKSMCPNQLMQSQGFVLSP